MTFTKVAAGALFAAAAAGMLPAKSEARIVCDKEFQVVGGSPIATPARR